MSSDQTTVDDLQKSTMDATAAKPPVAEKLPLAAQPPEGWVMAPVEVKHLFDFMAPTFVPVTTQQEQIAISLRLAKEAIAAAPKAEPVQQKDILAPEFTGIAEYKLNDLLARGFSINGYSIEQTHEGGAVTRGFITSGGFVGWWTSDAEIDARAARLAAARTQQEGER